VVGGRWSVVGGRCSSPSVSAGMVALPYGRAAATTTAGVPGMTFASVGFLLRNSCRVVPWHCDSGILGLV